MGTKDFRSDTVTKPTPAMRKAMYEAEVGDDVCEDDPTVVQLEELSAKMTGKESALFVPSGTFGNQLCIFTHTNMGDEILLSEQAHIIKHEAGSASLIASVQTVTIDTDGSYLTLNHVKHRIRDRDIHYPKTGLICLENALSNGTIMPLEEMEKVYNHAHKRGIPVHLDGARLFNASVALNIDAAEIARFSDSIMFCLSKGLCAPIGSMVCGNKNFINKARFNRKKMGGGMRQVGVIAAPGLVALKEMVDRLYIDHDNAKYLGSRLSQLDGIEINLDNIQINMVFFSVNEKSKISNEDLIDRLIDKGFKLYPPEDGKIRIVTNYGTDKSDIDILSTKIENLVK
jgi:threonine aldolase